MTAPVAVQTGRANGTSIAMTAPVAQHRDAGEWVIRFFMPSQWTLETLPEPDDDRVELVVVAPEKYAVLRFSGGYGTRRSPNRPRNCGTSCARPVSNRPARRPPGSTTRRGPCRAVAATKSPSRSRERAGATRSLPPLA